MEEHALQPRQAVDTTSEVIDERLQLIDDFPILMEPDRQFPSVILRACEERIVRNHYQPLDKLWARGGLSVHEIICATCDLPVALHASPPPELESMDRLMQIREAIQVGITHQWPAFEQRLATLRRYLRDRCLAAEQARELSRIEKLGLIRKLLLSR